MVRVMLFDNAGRHLRDLRPTSATRSRQTDGTDALRLSVQGVGISKDDRVVTRDAGGEWCEWLVLSADASRTAALPSITANCVESMRELGLHFIPSLRRGSDETAAAALARALEDTRWEVGECAESTADYSMYHVSALDAIKDICDTHGLVAWQRVTLSADGSAIGHRYIDLVRLDDAAGPVARIEWARDLASVRRTVASDEVVTRLYGYGKGVETDSGGYGRKLDFSSVNDGLPYVEDAAALARWGVPGPDGTLAHAEGVFEDSGCEDAEVLLAETKAELARLSVPKVSYECDWVAIGARVRPGDMLQVVDGWFDPALRVQAMVLKCDEDLLDPARGSVTLGSAVDTLTGSMGGQGSSTGGVSSGGLAIKDESGVLGSYMYAGSPVTSYEGTVTALLEDGIETYWPYDAAYGRGDRSLDWLMALLMDKGGLANEDVYKNNDDDGYWDVLSEIGPRPYNRFSAWQGKRLEGTFLNCANLTEATITMPVNEFTGEVMGVMYLGRLFFAGCKSLARAHVEYAGVVGERCFLGCESLASIHLPRVTLIEPGAFAGAVGAQSIWCPSLQGFADVPENRTRRYGHDNGWTTDEAYEFCGDLPNLTTVDFGKLPIRSDMIGDTPKLRHVWVHSAVPDCTRGDRVPDSFVYYAGQITWHVPRGSIAAWMEAVRLMTYGTSDASGFAEFDEK